MGAPFNILSTFMCLHFLIKKNISQNDANDFLSADEDILHKIQMSPKLSAVHHIVRESHSRGLS